MKDESHKTERHQMSCISLTQQISMHTNVNASCDHSIATSMPCTHILLNKYILKQFE